MTVDLLSLPRWSVDPSLGIGSPDWWLATLGRSLPAKRAHHDLMRRYAAGDAPLVDIAVNVREAYVAFQRRARTNYAGLSVDAMLELIRPCAIRTGAQGDEYGDQLAWDMWQANGLDADAPALHRDTFVTGESFAIVGDVDPTTGAPRVTVEDSRSVAAARDPLRRRALRAAVKMFTDEWTGDDHAFLTLRGDQVGEGRPSMVWRASRGPSTGADGWKWIGDPTPLPFDAMPVVWFPNQLDVDGKTTWGEFEQHTDVLDRISTTTLQRLVIAAMQAFRQRLLKGLPKYDENGEEIDYDGVFAADPAAIWQVPEGVEIWESAATDLGPLLNAARDDVKDFAAVTRTPLPALSPDAANQSGANTELVKSGHVAKCVDRIAALSESWEEVVGLMFRWTGDQVRASRRDMEMLWTPPNLPSMAERFDAAVKAQAAGVPRSHIMLNIVGMSPQEMARDTAAIEPPAV